MGTTLAHKTGILRSGFRKSQPVIHKLFIQAVLALLYRIIGSYCQGRGYCGIQMFKFIYNNDYYEPGSISAI
jgi:hypothetical protein